MNLDHTPPAKPVAPARVTGPARLSARTSSEFRPLTPTTAGIIGRSQGHVMVLSATPHPDRLPSPEKLCQPPRRSSYTARRVIIAHNLFGERFVSSRVPAWHQLGLVLQQPVSARQAWNLAGPYEVGLEDLVASPSGPVASHKAIIRRPCKGDPKHRVFAVVGAAYQLITPAQFCDLWDQHVRAPIETLGALGHGEVFFVSTKLPSFSVRGD